MGIYVNPGNAAFEMARFSDIYVDKSMLIARLNAAYRTEKRFFCVSRPRRFGKSMAANMLSAYYSCGCDSEDLFCGLKIEDRRRTILPAASEQTLRVPAGKGTERDSKGLSGFPEGIV